MFFNRLRRRSRSQPGWGARLYLPLQSGRLEYSRRRGLGRRARGHPGSKPGDARQHDRYRYRREGPNLPWGLEPSPCHVWRKPGHELRRGPGRLARACGKYLRHNVASDRSNPGLLFSGCFGPALIGRLFRLQVVVHNRPITKSAIPFEI